MLLWLKSRRVAWVAASVVGTLVTVVVVGNVAVSMPLFAALYGLQVPLAIVAPAGAAITLALALANGESNADVVAVRPVSLLDTLFVSAAASVVALACVLLQLLEWTPFGLAAARNAIGLSGLMLLGRPLGLRVAALLPVVFLVTAAVFGEDSEGSPVWWAWPMATDASLGPWAIAAVLAAGGLLVSWRVSRAELTPV